MIISRLPMGGGGGGSAKINIFTQTTEPNSKDGIWVQTSNQYKNIAQLVAGDIQKEGYWQTVASPATPYSTMFEHGGYLYFSTYERQIYRYSEESGVTLLNNESNIGSTNAFLFNGNICALSSYLYKFDFSSNSWEIVKDSSGTNVLLNYEGYSVNGGTVYNGELYYSNMQTNLKYDGKTITNIGKVNGFCNGNSVVYNGKLYIINAYDGTKYTQICYAFDGTSWQQVANMPELITKSSLVSYGGFLNSIGGSSGSYGKKSHYIYSSKTNTWTRLNDIPLYSMFKTRDGATYRGKMYVPINNVSGDSSYLVLPYFITPSEQFEPQTIVFSHGNNTANGNGKYVVSISDISKVIDQIRKKLPEELNIQYASKFKFGFDDCYYFADTAFDWDAPMYYGDGTKWIKFKN